MQVKSLFSGVGGMDLGVERVFGPSTHQVEFDSWCRKVLALRFPNAERFVDVSMVGRRELGTGGILIGGFPCQDVSSAGKGAGLAGARSGLWREYLRIIEETHPEGVIIENVASGARRWLPFVRRDLHLLGYDTVALGISASDVGAPHQRRRVFVLAYPMRLDEDVRRGEREGLSLAGGPSGCGRARALPAADAIGDELADARGEGLPEPRSVGLQAEQPLAAGGGGGPAGQWLSEPNVGRVVGRPARGVDARTRRRRLKACGNICVPQCAEVAARVLKDILEKRLIPV